MNNREPKERTRTIKMRYSSHLNTNISMTYTSAQHAKFNVIGILLKNQLMGNVFIVSVATQITRIC